VKPPKFTFKHIAPLMIAAVVTVPFWITLAGHVVFGKHKWLVKDNPRINQSVYGTRPFNLWNLLTFSWIQMGLAWLPIIDASVKMHVYVILLVLILLHNLGENEVIPRERRLSASVFTWFELGSYFVHLVTVCQLSMLMFSLSAFKIYHEAVFNIFLMRVPTDVLWTLVAGAAALFGAIPVILREVRVFKAPEAFYLFCGVIEIPIIFNVLDHPEQERLAIFFMALFLLADSTVWMYFKRVYSGRNVLDAGEHYKKLDLMFKFIVVYLFFALEDFRPEMFFAIATGIFLVQFVIILAVQPCGQKRGNIFHMGCSAVLTLSSLYCLAVTLQVLSLESLFAVGVGVGTTGIVVITLASMVLAKTPPSVVMQEAMGQPFHADPLAERQTRFDNSTPRLFTLFAVLFNLSLIPTITIVLLTLFFPLNESVLLLYLAELPLMCVGAGIGMLVQRPRSDRTDMVLIGLLGFWLGATFFVQYFPIAYILRPGFVLLLLFLPLFTLAMYFLSKRCAKVTPIAAFLLMIPLLAYFILDSLPLF